VDQFNLENVYGSFLDILETQLANINDEPITHFGVKGMKWGVRKDRSSQKAPLKSLGPDSVVRKTASGEEVRLSKIPPSRFQNFMGRRSKKFRESYADQAYLTIHDGSGKKIGEAQVAKKSKDELNLVWLGINKSARGQGYATAVMKAGAEFGRQEGFKKLTLEVPKNSPDARHIYEKLGFKVVKEPTAKEMEDDIVFGGLTEMAYDVNEAQHLEEGMGMSYNDKPGSPEELLHYGVKGMKWGVRKKGNRVAGAILDQNQRNTAVLKRAREGRGATVGERVGRGVGIGLYGGKGRYNRRVDKALGDLEAQRKRVESGKLAARDVLDFVSSVPVTDLFVSRRDTRG
jgi:RimJ/RimL family protein N-acetyltransferase